MFDVGSAILGAVLAIVSYIYLWPTIVNHLNRVLWNKSGDSIQGSHDTDDVGNRPWKNSNVSSFLPLSQVNHHNPDANGSFVTQIIGRLWPYMNEALCPIAKDELERILEKSSALPGPLRKYLRVTCFELGAAPLRLDNVIVHGVEMEDNVSMLQVDVDVVWDGLSNIQLSTRDNLVSLGVRHFKISGRICFIVQPLQARFPDIVAAIQCAFINPPAIQLDVTGLAQIAEIGIIKSTIHKGINDVCQKKIVLPNRLVVRLDNTVPYYMIHKHPIGVIRVTLMSGHGFRTEKRLLRQDDFPDVYCKLSVGGITWKSSIIKNSNNPVWNNEMYDFVLYDYHQSIFIQTYDHDQGNLDQDDDLGTGTVTARQLLHRSNRSNFKVELVNTKNNQKPTGAFVQIRADFCYFTQHTPNATDSTCASSHSGSLYGGIVTILLSRVSVPYSLVNVELSKYIVIMKHGDGSDTNEVEASPVKVLRATDSGMSSHYHELLYDKAFMIPLGQNVNPSNISFFLYSVETKGTTTMTPPISTFSSNNKINRTLLGTYVVCHQKLLEDKSITETTATFIGSQGINLEYRITFSRVSAPSETIQALSAAGSSPIFSVSSVVGSISIYLMIVSGRGFKIQKRKMMGIRKRADIPDCYVIVQCGPHSQSVWRTSTIKDSTTPVWNECRQFDNIQHGMVVTMHVYDENSGKRDSDDYIGTARINVDQLLSVKNTIELELSDTAGVGIGAFISISGHQVTSNKTNTSSTCAALTPSTNALAKDSTLSLPSHYGNVEVHIANEPKEKPFDYVIIP